MKFKPVDVSGKKVDAALADIARGLNSLHQCVHSGHEAQAERDQAADQKREQLAGEVGKIQTQQVIDGGRITALAKAIGTETVEKGEAKPVAKVGMGWKEHLKIAGSVVSAITLAALLYQFGVAVWPGVHTFLMELKP